MLEVDDDDEEEEEEEDVGAAGAKILVFFFSSAALIISSILSFLDFVGNLRTAGSTGFGVGVFDFSLATVSALLDALETLGKMVPLPRVFM